MLTPKAAILFKIVRTCAMTPKAAILFKIVHTYAKECLILKYKYVQNPWSYPLKCPIYFQFWVLPFTLKFMRVYSQFLDWQKWQQRNQNHQLNDNRPISSGCWQKPVLVRNCAKLTLVCDWRKHGLPEWLKEMRDTYKSPKHTVDFCFPCLSRKDT